MRFVFDPFYFFGNESKRFKFQLEHNMSTEWKIRSTTFTFDEKNTSYESKEEKRKKTSHRITLDSYAMEIKLNYSPNAQFQRPVWLFS